MFAASQRTNNNARLRTRPAPNIQAMPSPARTMARTQPASSTAIIAPGTAAAVSLTFLDAGFERWHDFFLLAGTAGATLLGLLFVSVSLKTEVIMRSSERHLRSQAMSAFESLLFTMILSLALLIPFGSVRYAGVFLVTLGLVGVVRSGMHVLSSGHDLVHAAAAALRRRLLLPVAAHAVLVWTGIELLTQRRTSGLFLMVAPLWLLITATRTAWQLLVEVGEAR